MMFMRFAIDAVFLGKPDPGREGARPVVSVHRGLRAWTGLVPLVRGAHGVLELPVGTIERSGTAVGDLVVLEPAARYRRKRQESAARHHRPMATLRRLGRSCARSRIPGRLFRVRSRGRAAVRHVPARARCPAGVAGRDADRASGRAARAAAPARMVRALRRTGPGSPPRPEVRRGAAAWPDRSARRWPGAGHGSGPAPRLVVPVPVHAERERQRGYDQAALIADGRRASGSDCLSCGRSNARRATVAQFELGSRRAGGERGRRVPRSRGAGARRSAQRSRGAGSCSSTTS